MKELLHSRLFRKNLKKWLFMYVGTICLLTSVITYSKYISAFNGSDTAKTAKFNVKVSLDSSMCETASTTNVSNHCYLADTRPLPSYDFGFIVDTTELEVNTLVVVTLKAGEGFTLPDKIMEGNKEIPLDGNKITLDIDVNDSNRVKVKKYKATLAYDNKKDIPSNEPHTGLEVDYSAIQQD